MMLRLRNVSLMSLAVLAVSGACAPKPATPEVDTMATAVAQAAFGILAKTAAAASPTPHPPTHTPTPPPTETATSTPTSSGPPRRPQTTIDYAECFLYGPGAPYQHDTFIAHGKAVDLLGVGSVPGWYIIREPYFHRVCWIQADLIKIFPGTDLSKYPVMTPGP